MSKTNPQTQRVHYAWIIASVTFLVLLVTAAVRATPGILMVPLESEFGWSSASISAAVAVSIALFGSHWAVRGLTYASLGAEAYRSLRASLIDRRGGVDQPNEDPMAIGAALGRLRRRSHRT